MSRLLELPNIIFRRIRRTLPPARRAYLTRDRVYILPTAAGLLFALAVLLMLLGSINYGLGLGFALTFLLAGVGVTAMLLTHRNLAGIEIHANDAQPVFTGESAIFAVHLRNGTGVGRLSIQLRSTGATTGDAWSDVPANSTQTCLVHVPATRRGTLDLPLLRISATFPLGLFQAWSDIDMAARCTVYPALEPRTVAASPSAPTAIPGNGHQPGDDFAGLRAYAHGDTPARIAWTALARGAGMVSKQFDGDHGAYAWVRWSDVAPHLPTEAALMRLARWIVELSREGRTFGFDIPGCSRAPDTGPAHVHVCLSALAHFRSHE
jgi:uncharacterized protein (DUF58 family)